MTVTVMLCIYIFVLACFAGYQLISRVPPTLHTPLMSGSNAISGITVVGAMQVAAGQWEGNVTAANIIGCLAVFFAAINIAGGFGVTGRMLSMFKRKDS